MAYPFLYSFAISVFQKLDHCNLDQNDVEMLKQSLTNLPSILETNNEFDSSIMLDIRKSVFGLHELLNNQILPSSNSFSSDVVRQFTKLNSFLGDLVSPLTKFPKSSEEKNLLSSLSFPLPQIESQDVEANNNLPLHLVPCLAYCALYPVGSRIIRETLVNQWMAEGFLELQTPGSSSGGSGDLELEDIGDRYFMELLSLGVFVEPMFGFGGDSSTDQQAVTIHSCEIHPQMHNVARQMARKEILVNLNLWDINVNPYTFFVPPTLCLVREDIDLSGLQILDMAGIQFEKLPASLRETGRLRYLAFSRNTLLKRLDNISWGSLQTLAVDGCVQLEKVNLENTSYMRHLYYTSKETTLEVHTSTLRILQLSYCSELRSFSFTNSANFTCLRRLRIFECPRLVSLPDSLDLLPHVEEMVFHNCARLDLNHGTAMDSLPSLLYLELIGLPKLKKLPAGLRSANSLLYLMIDNCQSLRTPDHKLLRHLVTLQKLCVHDCPNFSIARKVFQYLTALKSLDIRKCPKIAIRSDQWDDDALVLTSANSPYFHLSLETFYSQEMLDQKYKLTVLSKWKGVAQAWKAIVYLRFLQQQKLFQSYFLLTLFPSDYEIERDTLFQLWMVRGFRREHWENLFKQMIQEGYIEETDKSIGTAKYRINVGKVTALSNSSFTSKDHTLIENEEDTKVDGFASWKHVSVATKSIDITMFETLERLSDLRTLLLVRDYGSSLKHIPPTFFKACCSMQVLDLSGCHISELPSTIIYMPQLRFLDLSYTLIERFPESIHLKELQTLKLELQTLKLVGCKHLHKIPPTFFKACCSMQVLDLSGCHISELPSTIKYMTQLRFLGLSYTLIERIPESIQSLRELQTLKLVGCKHLHTLPRGMTGLVNLCHLDFDVLGQLTCMPKELGSLVKLRTLSAYIVSKEDGCSVRELRTMNSLCGSLYISGLENANHQHACEAAMHEKDHLTRLHLRWSHSISYNMEDCDRAFLSLLRLKVPPSLTELQILNYPGLDFPEWIQGLKNLVSITLLKCRVNNLTRLQRLPNLRHLNIYDLNEVRNINSECEDIVSFPQLETLTIDGMHSLISWVGWYKDKRVTDFPMLSKVSMKDCPKLPGLPFLSHLPSLEYLEISYCEAFQSLPEGTLSASLKTLIIDSCPLLKKRCLKNEADWKKIPSMTKILIDTESVSAEVSDDESEYYEDEIKYVGDESE